METHETPIPKEANTQVDIKSMLDIPKAEWSRVFDEVDRAEKEADWPEDWRAPRASFESRAKIFPDGFFVAIVDGKIVGMTTSEIVNYSEDKMPSTWDDVTDNGLISNSHDESGNALYVVSVAVSRNNAGQGIGKKLVEAQKELTRRLNKDFLFLGARIPGYQDYHMQNPGVSADEYANLKNDNGRFQDNEIGFYNACGLRVKKVIPNYGPDEPSENNGVIMVWENSG